MTTSFIKMCRLCACEKPKASVNMFGDIGKRHLLPDKIRLCLPISIDEDDKLPKEICIACLYKLDMCNELYNTSFTAQNILKTKLENILYDQPQFLKENYGDLNGVGCHDSNEEDIQPKLSSGSRQSLKEIEKDRGLVENDVHEPQNSSVISQEVAIRLTSGESHSVRHSSTSNIFAFENPMDLDAGIPGIIVTDITGAPLAPLHSDEDIFGSLPLDGNLTDDFNDMAMKEKDSSPRLVNEKDKEDSCALSTEIKQESTPLKKHKFARDKTKPVAKKKFSGNVKCKFCLKWFSKSMIGYHQRLHLNESVYSCVDCGKNFKSEENLSSHSCGQT